VQEVCVLFVDVTGSTSLYEAVGDDLAHRAIDDCIAMFREKTHGAGGRVVKTIGDEVMAVFPQASSAADAAVEMQAAIEQMPRVGDVKMGARIGFQHGAVVERDGDVFGDTVNIAARLSSLAARGQVMTSRETVERMTAAQRRLTRRLYSIPVKGKANEVDLYEILWQESEEQTTLASQRSVVDSPSAKLLLRYLGNELVLKPGSNAVTLGRDKEAGIVIVDRMASRTHAKIDCRLGKFLLHDHSANGTYVAFQGEPEILLRREEILLRGRGVIAFGQPSSNASDVMEFACE
jgi:adenylate cyclase